MGPRRQLRPREEQVPWARLAPLPAWALADDFPGGGASPERGVAPASARPPTRLATGAGISAQPPRVRRRRAPTGPFPAADRRPQSRALDAKEGAPTTLQPIGYSDAEGRCPYSYALGSPFQNKQDPGREELLPWF